MHLTKPFIMFFCLLLLTGWNSLRAEVLQYSLRYVDPEKGFTLQDLALIAAKNNPALQESSYRIQEAQALRQQAGLRPNPELQFSAGSSSIAGDAGEHEWTASYVQPLELGGKRGKRIKASDLSIQIVTAEAFNRKREIISELSKAFAEVLAGAASLQAIEEALDLAGEIHNIAVARVQEGESAAIEKELTEVELNRHRAEAATLEAQVLGHRATLQRITGKTESQMKLRGELFPVWNLQIDNLQELISLAKANRPDLKAAVLAGEFAEAEAALAKAERISDLDAFVAYGMEKSRFDQFGINENGTPERIEDSDRIISGGISLELPLFNRNQGNIQAALARKQAAATKKLSIEKAIELEVQLAFDRYTIAKANYEKFKDSILAPAQQQLNIIRTAYQEGEIRLFDLLTQQRNVLTVRQGFIAAAREYFVASVELESATAYSIGHTGGNR